MVVCPYCKEKNLINQKFCENCGKPLSDEVPSYLYTEDEDLWEKVKKFGKDVEQKIKDKDYKKILADKSDPLTNMLITFIAWFLLRTIGILPFIILVRVLAFLMHPVGLVFSLAVTYVYSIHRDEIMKKYEELKSRDHIASIKELIDSFQQNSGSDADDKDEENS
ncbi:MAG: zinc ribbon domain-containing protein [Firmicutes bacterium]|nr:zinc ribbon domain-containing protein [Bacillota bacterium]